jgi:hypothetical protein
MFLAGCGGSALLVQRDARGGVIALDGDRADAMTDAGRKMANLCGGSYTIVGEGTTPLRYYRRTHVRGDTVFYSMALDPPVMQHRLRYLCGDHPDKRITTRG